MQPTYPPNRTQFCHLVVSRQGILFFFEQLDRDGHDARRARIELSEWFHHCGFFWNSSTGNGKHALPGNEPSSQWKKSFDWMRDSTERGKQMCSVWTLQMQPDIRCACMSSSITDAICCFFTKSLGLILPREEEKNTRQITSYNNCAIQEQSNNNNIKKTT